MDDQARLQRYRDLVRDVANDYRERVKKDPNGLRWHNIEFEDGAEGEINLWTYWQGIGFKKVKLLLIGQDWGCLECHESVIDDIKAVHSNPNTDRIVTTSFPSDKNLIKAFNRLGRRINEVRYPDLFFTNLCLGYRQDKSTGKLPSGVLQRDADTYLARLVDIIEPELVVCLGKDTAEKAFKALEGEELLMPDGYYGYLDSQTLEGRPLKKGALFFVMPHPGARGMNNRRERGKDDFRDWNVLKMFFE